MVCTNIYWDREGRDVTPFRPGDFERLYSDKVKIQIKYPDGISTLELVTLPALIQHLEAIQPDCKLRFESVRDSSEGAIVTIAIDEVEDRSSGQIEQLRAAIQAEAEQKAQYLRYALESEKQATNRLRGQVESLQWAVTLLHK